MPPGRTFLLLFLLQSAYSLNTSESYRPIRSPVYPKYSTLVDTVQIQPAIEDQVQVDTKVLETIVTDIDQHYDNILTHYYNGSESTDGGTADWSQGEIYGDNVGWVVPLGNDGVRT